MRTIERRAPFALLTSLTLGSDEYRKAFGQ
jgi:hypothetical protein